MIIPALADIQREKERRRLTASQLAFTCAMFESVHNMKFSIGAPQEIICDTLDRVVSGEIKRLIINISPGYSKTEIAVINFMARGIAADPSCRFIHATYSQTLALDNSSKVRDVINCELFKELWNVEMKADTSAKGLWRTTKGGGVRAASSGEPITGFRAGHLIEEGKPWKFTGALIIDDPLKPDDAHSDTTRKFINARWHNTFKSRLASEDVPVIVIMQRLHTDDFVANLLETSGEKWHVLKLPILIDGECEPIHENAIMIPHNLPNGPLWDKKHTLEQIEVLKLSPHVFAGQYMQEPVTEGGNLFKVENLQEYDELPQLQWRALYVDTAQKTGERNDYSVIQHWGRTKDGKAYLIDQMRAKFEAPELEAAALAMWMKARAYDIGKYGSLRKMAIEDKVSGTGLIQTLKRKAIPIVAIQRNRDKYTRALDAVPYVAAGLVYVPANVSWIKDFISEVAAFPEGAHDDQTDCLIDSVVEMCGVGLYTLDNL